MKFTKTLVAAVLLAGAASANASINSANTTASGAEFQIYDSTSGWTYDYNLNLTYNQLVNAVANKLTLNYDFSSDANWTTFTSHLTAGDAVVWSVYSGYSTNPLFTSTSSNPAISANASLIGGVTAIHNIEAQFNNNTTGNSLVVSDAAADFGPAGSGQYSNGAPGNPTAVDGTADYFSAINYGDSATFFRDGSTAALKATAQVLGTWTATGSTLTFTYAGYVAPTPTPAAVPVPSAIWMFAAGLMGVLGFNRRKAA